MRPSRVLPPVEFWRGVRPRKAANSRPLAKTPASWIVATIADAVTGPTPGMVISRLAVSSALTDAAISRSIAPIASSRASIWPTSGRSATRTQSGTTISPLRRDDADLGQMAAQRIERRRALAGEQFARPMAHQLGLVVDRTNRHEPLARPPRRLANRRRVNLVAFVAAHVGLHMRGRQQPNLMPELDQRPPPVMR